MSLISWTVGLCQCSCRKEAFRGSFQVSPLTCTLPSTFPTFGPSVASPTHDCKANRRIAAHPVHAFVPALQDVRCVCIAMGGKGTSAPLWWIQGFLALDRARSRERIGGTLFPSCTHPLRAIIGERLSCHQMLLSWETRFRVESRNPA